jgi:hypothetical protein
MWLEVLHPLSHIVQPVHPDARIDFISQPFDELPPGTAHAQVVECQRTQAAWVGFGRYDLVRPILEHVAETAIGIVNKNKFVHGSLDEPGNKILTILFYSP